MIICYSYMLCKSCKVRCSFLCLIMASTYLKQYYISQYYIVLYARSIVYKHIFKRNIKRLLMSFSVFKPPTLKPSLSCSYFLSVSACFSLLFLTSYFLPLIKQYIISLGTRFFHKQHQLLGLRFQNDQKLNNC